MAEMRGECRIGRWICDGCIRRSVQVAHEYDAITRFFGRYFQTPPILFHFHFCTHQNVDSFTVYYLITHCGFSPNTAISTSRKLRLDTPNSVLAFLATLLSSDLPDTLQELKQLGM
ncbi:hypothetical protein JHK85_046821 [Glycine max]|nr:hypothetical protein JHK85_046821 [Glycine max]